MLLYYLYYILNNFTQQRRHIMKKGRKKVSEYSSSELIHMARQAVSNYAIEKQKFKTFFNVDFTFLELCKSLNKRKIQGVKIMYDEEYEDVKKGVKDNELRRMLIEIQLRYEESLFRLHGDIV